jgi:hypothetical protein
MVDPGTGMAVLGSTPIVLKIVGPTADYVGGGLKNLAERQVRNVETIFSKAAGKLGEERLNSAGVVPARVLKEIFEHGPFCDDELGAEYFGGILASSKTGIERDDRGATLAALVGRMSTYQLRCHYVMYAHGQRLLAGSGVRLGHASERRQSAEFFMPYETWIEGMALTDDETSRLKEIAAHCGVGLMREGLIGSRFASGSPEGLGKVFERKFGEREGIVFELTVLGVELFMAAQGMHRDSIGLYVSPEAPIEIEVPVSLAGEVVALENLPE